MIDKKDAIASLCPSAGFSLSPNGQIIDWHNSEITQPTEEKIQNKLAELKAAEPMRLLRLERNQLLASTDWRMTTDYPYTDQAAWASYRTQLRNFPATAEPTLDETGNLTNVDWPTPPDQS